MACFLRVHKAQGFGDQDVEDMTIEASEPVPNFKSLKASAEWYDGEAEALERALHDHLPGGTYDRLLGLMLKRKASHFVVAHST